MIKIKSKTDVITNSSSETFIIHYPQTSSKELQELLEECRVNYGESKLCSGMGGIIRVSEFDNNNKYGDLNYTQEECYTLRIPYIPGSQVVEIDWVLKETINFLREYYPEAYEIDEKTFYPVYDEEGKKIQRLTENYQEWISLGNPLMMHGEWAVSDMDWWNYENKN